MDSSINKVLLSGNLGHNPELRYTPKGTPKVELRMATHRRIKVGEEWVDHADWHSVDVYGKTAETVAKFLTKGSPIIVEGQLQVDTWTDQETNKPRSKSRIFGERVHFLPRAHVKDSASPSAPVVEITPVSSESAPAEEPPF